MNLKEKIEHLEAQLKELKAELSNKETKWEPQIGEVCEFVTEEEGFRIVNIGRFWGMHEGNIQMQGIGGPYKYCRPYIQNIKKIPNFGRPPKSWKGPVLFWTKRGDKETFLSPSELNWDFDDIDGLTHWFPLTDDDEELRRIWMEEMT